MKYNFVLGGDTLRLPYLVLSASRLGLSASRTDIYAAIGHRISVLSHLQDESKGVGGCTSTCLKKK